jgi:hypothetical protein
MGWTIGVLGFDSRRGLAIFLFTTASRTALGSTQPPIQWVPGALSLGVKQPGREADQSLLSSAEVKEWVELYHHSPSMPPWRGAQLKHRNNFTSPFTFTEHRKLPVTEIYMRIDYQNSELRMKVQVIFLRNIHRALSIFSLGRSPVQALRSWPMFVRDGKQRKRWRIHHCHSIYRCVAAVPPLCSFVFLCVGD